MADEEQQPSLAIEVPAQRVVEELPRQRRQRPHPLLLQVQPEPEPHPLEIPVRPHRVHPRTAHIEQPPDAARKQSLEERAPDLHAGRTGRARGLGSAVDVPRRPWIESVEDRLKPPCAEGRNEPLGHLRLPLLLDEPDLIPPPRQIADLQGHLSEDFASRHAQALHLGETRSLGEG